MVHSPRFHSHQGWSIDDSHPSRRILNLNTIFDHLSNLYPTLDSKSSARSSWIRDVESYVQAHAHQVLSSPLFIQAPISALQRILSLPNLSVSEDFLLSRVLQYAADAANVLSESPAFWTDEERELILPVLLQLFPFVRTFSLSTKVFNSIVEPMKILNASEMIDKYKFDAFARQIGCSHLHKGAVHTVATVRRCYRDGSLRRDIVQKRLRGAVALSESAHPYHEGEDEVLEEVAVEPWAPRLFVEFDRRSSIGFGGRLSFYRDADAMDLIGTWHEMWPGGRQGVKAFVVEGCRFFVGFRSAFFDRTAWGWKLMAVPLFYEDDFK